MSTSSKADLRYRPRTYFWAADLGLQLTSDIKGAVRRRLYERTLLESKQVSAAITQPALEVKDRSGWGRIHPACMGGEYLPDRRREVEIARIVINSTTQDVTCVYARQRAHRIFYRVVDEYDGETLQGRRCRTSIAPLALDALIDFFLSAWDLMCCLDANFADDGYPRARVHGFVLEASSSFYPGFESAIRDRIDNWLEAVHAPVEKEPEA